MAFPFLNVCKALVGLCQHPLLLPSSLAVARWFPLQAGDAHRWSHLVWWAVSLGVGPVGTSGLMISGPICCARDFNVHYLR